MQLFRFLLPMALMGLFTSLHAQNPSADHGNKFEQLGTLITPPNSYHAWDGAPGPDYWQQRADYEIDCTLNTEEQRLDGSEWITYYNHSPQPLRYLWLQLDENQHSPKNDNQYFDPSSIKPVMSEYELKALETWRGRDKYGVNIEAVADENGQALEYTINQTMMRVELPETLGPGEHFRFRVDWHYYIVDRVYLNHLLEATGNAATLPRGGYEYFPEDDNYLYTITQWYPRLCAYTDFEGWQNNQFTGRGEFALTFGDYTVRITLPEDHMVGSTGECLNYADVLTPKQLERWEAAQTADAPVEIVTLKEAKAQEKAKPAKKTQTWIYHANQVRDFAWTASRKFVWDAMPHYNSDGKRVMCMSYYPKEAYPIYSRYSTKAVAHTLKTYSKYSIPYPYPTAISVEASNGMEYPMICFNPGRAEPDGTYTEIAKKSAISVIIHEVGHNYYPMIINSDERQWAWFDEGLNTFVQFLAEREFDADYQSWAGPPHQITAYMTMPKGQLEPIMTNSENIKDYFSNAYLKPATALNILRETIMGRELFDYAFREYGRRWAFKHPTPADFFRTMEDASGVDLDWFWRGWFYSTDYVDIALDSVKWYKVDLDNDPERREITQPVRASKPFRDLSQIRNEEAGIVPADEEDPELQDFYSNYKPWETADSVTQQKIVIYDEPFSKKEKQQQFGDKNYYELYFSNKGGLVMPVIIQWTYEDGSTEIDRIPAQIWRKNESAFTKVFVKEKQVKAIEIDPFRETADAGLGNNSWPLRQVPSRFQVFKKHKIESGKNPMQRANGKYTDD
ncbi:MAG: M1 family metallopeptidase [Phaeodactylibacter xiamenensis]|uniref:Aminopeptidase n=1 Tax=Phaeodactylibacter xiamenensis TaxID=1524460 RepID=A0A098S115_9BACT|nr:M1 family metallopeptidase [Phaeodactylibacter xiamenensis]KGE85518.1 aminopeptidase [Phaeodactylibacter xiamenensis]MCR9053767.1 M1 family metallopeptidase [bacterium]